MDCLAIFTLLTLLLAVSSLISKRAVYKAIDRNSNSIITLEELQLWIIEQDNNYRKNNAKELLKIYDSNNDMTITWDEYVQTAFGERAKEAANQIYQDKGGREVKSKDSDDEDTVKQIKVAVRRWKGAGGFSMSLKEFYSFAHPEMHQHMRHILVKETIEKYDDDKDGNVSTLEVLNKHGRATSSDNKYIQEGGFTTVEALLGLSDDNDDGLYSEAELGNWVMNYRLLLNKKEGQDLLLKIDKDENGSLSRAEFEDGFNHLKGSLASYVLHEDL